jgi:hypothetical protein
MQDIMDREPKPGSQSEHREGPVARTIEQQTAKAPSDWLQPVAETRLLSGGSETDEKCDAATYGSESAR